MNTTLDRPRPSLLDRYEFHTKINVPLLLQVAEYILDHPNHFDMGDWVCDTTGCIAGWAVALQEEGKRPTTLLYNALNTFSKESEGGWGGDWRHWEQQAKKLLRVNQREAKKLFFSDTWYRPWNDRFAAASTNKEKARVAYEYIHYYVLRLCHPTPKKLGQPVPVAMGVVERFIKKPKEILDTAEAVR